MSPLRIEQKSSSICIPDGMSGVVEMGADEVHYVARLPDLGGFLVRVDNGSIYTVSPMTPGPYTVGASTFEWIPSDKA